MMKKRMMTSNSGLDLKQTTEMNKDLIKQIELLKQTINLLEDIKIQQEERIKNFEFKLENIQKAISTNILISNIEQRENSIYNDRVTYIG
jgi:bacterioferritin (cytochrome b1)